MSPVSFVLGGYMVELELMTGDRRRTSPVVLQGPADGMNGNKEKNGSHAFISVIMRHTT